MRRMLGVLLVVTAVAAGCSDRRSGDTQPGDKLTVVATIFPLASVVEEIGGDDVRVRTLLTGSQSPHEFTLRPSQAQVLGDARLLFMVGLGVDQWAAKAADAAGGKHLRVVRLGEDLEVLEQVRAIDAAGAANEHEQDDHANHDEPSPASRPSVDPGSPMGLDDHDEHEHGGIDPHVWLDPVFMQRFAAIIAEQLAQADPPHADAYRRRAQHFIGQLQQLDQQYRQELSTVSNRYVVTYHSAFGYIARRYGLELVSVYDIQGAGLGSGRLENVVAFIDRHKVQVLFVEPQYPADKLQSLAQRRNLRLAVLDDLGSPGRPGYTSYLGMMRSNLNTLVENLKD